MDKHILIIGGGIAGLAAGVYARLNGFRATIFELHDLPGGLCTAWERKGYVFDGCIHYLFGSGEGQPFNQMWHELGAVQNRPMINHAEYQRITDGEHTLTVFTEDLSILGPEVTMAKFEAHRDLPSDGMLLVTPKTRILSARAAREMAARSVRKLSAAEDRGWMWA